MHENKSPSSRRNKKTTVVKRALAVILPFPHSLYKLHQRAAHFMASRLTNDTAPRKIVIIDAAKDREQKYARIAELLQTGDTKSRELSEMLGTTASTITKVAPKMPIRNATTLMLSLLSVEAADIKPLTSLLEPLIAAGLGDGSTLGQLACEGRLDLCKAYVAWSRESPPRLNTSDVTLLVINSAKVTREIIDFLFEHKLFANVQLLPSDVQATILQFQFYSSKNMHTIRPDLVWAAFPDTHHLGADILVSFLFHASMLRSSQVECAALVKWIKSSRFTLVELLGAVKAEAIKTLYTPTLRSISDVEKMLTSK